MSQYLGMPGTREYVDSIIMPIDIEPDSKFYFGEVVSEEEVSDLAD